MTEPSLAEIFRLAAETRERDLFTSLVGVVEKYDPGTGPPPGPPTVDVLPVISRALLTAGGVLVHEALPVITNVPVVFPQAGSFSLTWPLVKGDHVLLVCTNWSHQQWRETGSPSEPGDLRTHELGNAFALAGVLSKDGTLPTAADAAVIEVGGAVTHLQIGNTSPSFVALGALVESLVGDLAAEILGATAVPNDGGAGIQTAAKTALGVLGWTNGGVKPPVGAVDATKLKSE